MNLSAKLIIDRLKQHFSLTVSKEISAEPYLKYPVLYQKGLPLKKNLIYVIDDPEFTFSSAPRPDHVLLLFVGSTIPSFIKRYPNICHIESSVSTAWVFQVLQEIYQTYNEWTQSIFEQAVSSSSVQKLLELSKQAIVNPMFIIGMDFTVLGSTETAFHLKNSVFGSDEETASIVSSLKNDPNYENAVKHTGYFFYPGNDYAAPCLCVNIRINGRTSYRLLILPGEMPLDDTIGFLAEFLAQTATQIILSAILSEENNIQSLHSIFHDLLSNPKADYVETSRLLTSYGWMASHYYQCVLIQVGIQDQKSMTAKSICNYLENAIPETCALEIHGYIAAFINLNLTPMSSDTLAQKIACFVRDNLLAASYSRKMIGHFNLRRQYLQAQITLKMGMRKNPSSWIHHFNDIALHYFLEQSTSKLPAYMICHERLLQLKCQDEKCDSQLYETLRCYLNSHQSPTKTAQAMYIHRSTLLYRLDRIRSILKSDLSDPDELLYLQLSYHLIDEEDKQ